MTLREYHSTLLQAVYLFSSLSLRYSTSLRRFNVKSIKKIRLVVEGKAIFKILLNANKNGKQKPLFFCQLYNIILVTKFDPKHTASKLYSLKWPHASRTSTLWSQYNKQGEAPNVKTNIPVLQLSETFKRINWLASFLNGGSFCIACLIRPH